MGSGPRGHSYSVKCMVKINLGETQVDAPLLRYLGQVAQDADEIIHPLSLNVTEDEHREHDLLIDLANHRAQSQSCLQGVGGRGRSP